MISFNDLIFEKHPSFDGLQAKMFFDNGYGVSVIRFKMRDGTYGSYTSNEQEWEIAILTGNNEEWHITYETPISESVLNNLSNDDVSDIMRQVQELKDLNKTKGEKE